MRVTTLGRDLVGRRGIPQVANQQKSVLPAFAIRHLAHDDLAGSKQRPEQHGGTIRRRQHPQGLDASFELFI
jgi:hypothetical protein